MCEFILLYCIVYLQTFPGNNVTKISKGNSEICPNLTHMIICMTPPIPSFPFPCFLQLSQFQRDTNCFVSRKDSQNSQYPVYHPVPQETFFIFSIYLNSYTRCFEKRFFQPRGWSFLIVLRKILRRVIPIIELGYLIPGKILSRPD